MRQVDNQLCDILGHEYIVEYPKATARCAACGQWAYWYNGRWLDREEYQVEKLRLYRAPYIANMVELSLDAIPPIEHTVAFTGHRPQHLGGFKEYNPLNTSIRKKLREAIERAHREGYYHFLSGGALGVDQWAAKEVLRMKRAGSKVSLFIARPFDTQERPWGKVDQHMYWRLLNKATGVYTVGEPGYAPTKMFRRNEWMVENSSLLIAVYDGSRKGGTAQCVSYARKLSKEVWTIPVPANR